MPQIEHSKRQQACDLGAHTTNNRRRAEAETENIEEVEQVERVAEGDDSIDASEERRLQAGQSANRKDSNAQIRSRLAARGIVSDSVESKINGGKGTNAITTRITWQGTNLTPATASTEAHAVMTSY